MFLLDTAKVAGDVPGAAKQLHTLLERNQAEILVSRPWDERRLAYPVAGHKKGLYYLIYLRTQGSNIDKIEQDCHLNEMILRQLILKVAPKLVDSLLAVARDEHALALHTATEPPADDNGEATPGAVEGIEEGAEEHRPPRRPRRSQPAGGKE
jgi:small subunit ribosomal protein S6